MGFLAVATAFVIGVAAPAVHADPVDEKEKQIEEQFHTLEGVIEDYNRVNEEFKETAAKVEALEKELKPFEDQLAVLYEEVGAIARNIYMGGQMTGTMTALTTGSPDTLAERMTLLDQVTADSSDAIDRLNDAKASLDERKGVLDGLYETQSQQESEMKAKKETITADIERLSGERDKAYRDSRGLSDDSFIPPFVPGKRGEVVRFALKQVGDDYGWAAEGPDVWDCSGLMLGAWKQVGVHLPHNAAMEWNQLQHISRDELQPGDLVFYNGLNHVAMYIGGDHVVHASDYGIGVIISTVDKGGSPYYGSARVPGF
ncbi:C40 family peptidase [Actinorhabdospora filicis]|nr:C40 family peptidase [Actinorhabdospora filicis]